MVNNDNNNYYYYYLLVASSSFFFHFFFHSMISFWIFFQTICQNSNSRTPKMFPIHSKTFQDITPIYKGTKDIPLSIEWRMNLTHYTILYFNKTPALRHLTKTRSLEWCYSPRFGDESEASVSCHLYIIRVYTIIHSNVVVVTHRLQSSKNDAAFSLFLMDCCFSCFSQNCRRIMQNKPSLFETSIKRRKAL